MVRRTGADVLFYDDALTSGFIAPPIKSFMDDPKFSKKKFKNDFLTVMNMYQLDTIPKNSFKITEKTDQKSKQKYGPLANLSIELRSRSNDLITRRIAYDIRMSKKSFIPIGAGHIEDYHASNGETIPPIQDYLRKYLSKYKKKVAVIKFIEKDDHKLKFIKKHVTGYAAQFDHIDAEITWPAWVSNSYD
ncbi:MAG: hypothetical protein GY730_07990 [bacterium]|nr:hypothetical protein [bacterium]